MGAADEEWVRAAMTDDNLVVELLVKLHRAEAPARSKDGVLPPLEWSVRQRRSKPITVGNKPSKLSHRASPTTPLSWSGGGCSEESTPRQPFKPASTTARSKIIIQTDKTASRRSRKKKTLAELKGEEHSLYKERRELKREIAATRANLERQRMTNENLKRMKIELQPLLDPESISESTSGQHKVELAHCQPGNVVALQPSTSNPCAEDRTDEASNPKISLPDLNVPFNETNSDLICGVS